MSLPPEDQVCEQPPAAPATKPTPAPQAQSKDTYSRIGAKAQAGINEQGDIEAKAAALSGRDPNTGIEMDVFSAYAKTGGQTGVGVRMAKVGVSSDNGANNASMDVFSATVNGGTRNRDGSRGVNADISATAIAAEGTLGYSGNSVTGGLSIGLGANAGVGIRDQDGDGSSELCVNASLKILLGAQVGFCVENPF
jgi:hypothetical protein